LPLASRTILAGIKTSAIIDVGTATVAALIGVGGLGEPIISGLNLNDYKTILQGAIPAALLALLVQFFFDGLERVFIPKGLRLKQRKLLTSMTDLAGSHLAKFCDSFVLKEAFQIHEIIPRHFG
jgi:Binding-protein-dependent transport system inner membrane component